MKLKTTLILLIFLVLLPALFYSAYEISTLNDTEQMMNEIYAQQQNTLLYSVNQYAWDISNSWASRIESMINPDPWSSFEEVRGFMDGVPGLSAVIIADTSLKRIELLVKEADTDVPRESIIAELRRNEENLGKMIYRKKLGYSKIESFTVVPDSNSEPVIGLLFLAELTRQRYYTLAMMINSQSFITEILSPKLQEIARTEFDLGIFRKDEATPVYSVNTIEDTTGFMKRRIWLFPDHYLGIRLSGTSFQDIARNRFKRNLQLIALLDLMLLFGAWMVFRNIRRQVELSRMKSDFVSNVSHELRTPLALIRMFIETLEMGRVKNEQKKQEYYTIIGQETERLTYLINNILDFSKMEAGKKEYRMEETELNSIVDKSIHMYEYHLNNKGFTFEKRLSSEELPVKGDPNAITESLINLLENAIKYSEDQKYIALRTFKENKQVIIEIEDKGIGIPVAQQKKIFDKFYRVSTGLTHNTKGSGLGLSIVKHIMKAHGGEVTVFSQPGKGSRFQLRFPLLTPSAT